MGMPSPQYSYGASKSTTTMTSALQSTNDNEAHRAVTGGLPIPQNSLSTSLSNGDGRKHSIWANGNYSYGNPVNSNAPSPRPRAAPARFNPPTKEIQASVSTKRNESFGQNGSGSYPAPPSAWSRPANVYGSAEINEPLGHGSTRAKQSGNGHLSSGASYSSNPGQPLLPVNGPNHKILSVNRGNSDTNLTRYHNLSGSIDNSKSPSDLKDIFNTLGDGFLSSQRPNYRTEPNGQPSPTDDWNNGGSDQHGQSSSNTSHKGSLPPSRAGYNSRTPEGHNFPRQGRMDGLPLSFSTSSMSGEVHVSRGGSQAPPGLELYQSGLTQSHDARRGSPNEMKEFSHARRSSNLSNPSGFQQRNALDFRTGNGLNFGLSEGNQHLQLPAEHRSAFAPTLDGPNTVPFENQYNFLGNQNHTIRNGSITPRRVHRQYQHSSRSTPPSGIELSSSAAQPFRHGSDQTVGHVENMQEVNDRFSRMLPNCGPDQYLHPNIHQLSVDQPSLGYPEPWMFRGTQMNGLNQYTPISQVPSSMLLNLSDHSSPEDVEVDRRLRSSKLQEFKSSHGLKNNRPWEIKDIYGHLSEFCGDQQGSRFVQNKLKDGLNSDEMQKVFTEIEPNALQLMMDVFGNYVMQKLFEHANQVQKMVLADKMTGNVLKLALQVYGCRSVQKAFEHVLVDQQAALVKELEGNVLTCVDDQHGNHCIQMAIAHIPIAHIQFIADAFRNKVEDYATHTFGCRVIQRLLEKCKGPAKSRLLQELHATGSRLITNQFGNYVTQHMIRHGTDEDRALIFTHIQAQIVAFSRQKFASNVVEACIEKGTDEQKRIIMTKMCQPNERGTSHLPILIGDSYANYVLQKLLSHLKQPDLGYFVDCLRPEIMKARRLNPTKHVEHLYVKVMAGPAQVGAQEINQNLSSRP